MDESEFWAMKNKIDSEVERRLSKLSRSERLSYDRFSALNDVLKEFKQQDPEKYREFVEFAKENGIKLYEEGKFESTLTKIILFGGLIGLALIIPIIGVPLLLIVILAWIGDYIHETSKKERLRIKKKLTKDK